MARRGTPGERPGRSSGRRRRKVEPSLFLKPIRSLSELVDLCEQSEDYRNLAIEAAASIDWPRREGVDAWREAVQDLLVTAHAGQSQFKDEHAEEIVVDCVNYCIDMQTGSDRGGTA
jgi:hypothetical protein